MQAIVPVLLAVIPVFLVLLAGGVLRRRRILEPAADQSLLRLTVNLLIPTFILHSLLGNDSVKDVRNLLTTPVLGFLLTAVSISIALLAAKAGNLSAERRRTFGFATGLHNYGYVPLPIALLLFDSDTVGLLFLFMMGVETAMWTLAPLVIGAGHWRSGLKKIFTPPFAAILVSVGVNLAGWDAFVPQFLDQTLRMLGQCAVPIALILSGASIADLMPDFYRIENGRAMMLSILVRMIILPPLFILCAAALPVSSALSNVLILQGAMPSAIFSVVLARLYGGHPATALRVIIATTVAGIIGIPLWIQLGLWIVNHR